MTAPSPEAMLTAWTEAGEPKEGDLWRAACWAKTAEELREDWLAAMRQEAKRRGAALLPDIRRAGLADCPQHVRDRVASYMRLAREILELDEAALRKVIEVESRIAAKAKASGTPSKPLAGSWERYG